MIKLVKAISHLMYSDYSNGYSGHPSTAHWLIRESSFLIL